MLRVESVTSFIEKGLNELSQEKGLTFKFKLFAEFGKSVGRGEVEGVVRSAKGTPTNIKDYEDIDFPFTCTLIVSSQISNYNIINVRSIVDKFIQDNNNKEITIDDGVGIFTFSMSNVGDYKIDAGYGGNVPVRFDINVRYTTNSVTASNKRWFLNDIEIPYLSESILIDKDGITRKINGESYSKTQLTGQVKSYRFVFPYDTRSELCTMLQQDILNGDFEKTYELKYYDGKAFTEEQPFVSTVSIYKNADTSAQPTKTSMFNITFTDVDNGSGSVKYYLALCDTVFDNNSENTRFFEATSTKTAQEVQIEYWESKISCAYEQIKAPNLNSIDITSQVYKNTNNYELFDLTNKNYAIIKIEQNGTPIKYYYYFVTNAQIGAQNQVLFDLKLDTIQTYIFNEDLEFSDCLITKAHLNRWIDNGDGTVSFDGTVNSKLFEREDIINVPKRLTKRTKLKFYGNSDLAIWLENNVSCWLYLYGKPQTIYKYYQVKSQTEQTNSFESGTFIETYESNNTNTYNPFPIFCYPIYKINSGHIVINSNQGYDDGHISLDYSGLSKFIDLQDGGLDDFFTLKLSAQPPFNNLNNLNYEITGNNLYITSDRIGDPIQINPPYRLSSFSFQNDELFAMAASELEGGNQYGVLFITRQNYQKTLEDYIVDRSLTYNKNEIIGQNKNVNLNPKLLNNDYFEIKLSDMGENGFVYDFQKLNNNLIKTSINETYIPDITKVYFKIINLDGIYINENSKNLTGFVSQNDNSLTLSTPAYQSMIANNKNYFLQNSINRVSNVANGLLSTGLNLVTGNLGATVSSAVGTGTGLFASLINEKLTVDNLVNSPANITNAKGNIIFQSQYTELGYYIEEYDILPNEKQIINDYMDLFGFNYNQVDNIKNVWNIRKYHNYVQASIDAISGVSMSNIARTDIKQRFQNGIRFWNYDNIQYSLENYEKWLEN